MNRTSTMRVVSAAIVMILMLTVPALAQGPSRTAVRTTDGASGVTTWCPNNKVQNGDFTASGLVQGLLGGAGVAPDWSYWDLPYVEAEVLVWAGGGCLQDAGYIGMMGTSYGGSGIQQTLTAPAFQAFHTYHVEFCARFWTQTNIQVQFPVSYAQFHFMADAQDIGTSGDINSTSWATYSLPDWTPSVDCSVLKVCVTNHTNSPSPVDSSYGEIDKICIEEVKPDNLGAVEGYKWNDVNGNCIFDQGEIKMAGWKIKLSNGMSATTDQNGSYTIPNVPPGTYTVSEQPQSGWKQTCPINPATYSVTVNPLQTVSNINFGNQIDSCISTDTLIINTGYDHSAFGVYPTGMFDNSWTLSAQPAALGQNVPRPAAVIPSYPANWSTPMTNSRWLSAYQSPNIGVNGKFSYVDTFCLADTRTVDLSLRVLADDSAAVYINGHLVGQTPTEPFPCSGNCNFQVPHFFSTTNLSWFNAGPNELRIDVANVYGVATGLDVSGTIVAADSVFTQNCCDSSGIICGYKWNDIDGDCIMDPNEPKLAGWKILLSNGAWVWTDQDGYYFFDHVPMGSYTVSEQPQSGWTQTCPQSPGTYSVTVGYQQVVGNINFGNSRACVPEIDLVQGISLSICDTVCQFGPCITIATDGSITPSNICTGTQGRFNVMGDQSGVLNVSMQLPTLLVGPSQSTPLNVTFSPTSSGWNKTDGTNPLDLTFINPNVPNAIPDSCVNEYFYLGMTVCFPVNPMVGTYTGTVIVTSAPGGTISLPITVTIKRCSPCPPETTLVINTGWDQDGNTVIPVGGLDLEWTVISDQNSTTHEPRPAYVVPTGYAWGVEAKSQWLSCYPGDSDMAVDTEKFVYRFCLGDSLGATLTFNIRVDNTALVYLNNNLIATVPVGTHAPTYTTVPISVTTPAFFRTGANTLRVEVMNMTGPIGNLMGFDLTGTITGHKPNYACCCIDSSGSIIGLKWNDLNGDGIRQGNEPIIRDWPVDLSNQMSMMTDTLGYFYFLNLPPGTYGLSEGSIGPNWTQTCPSSGSYSVVLDKCENVVMYYFGNAYGLTPGTIITPVNQGWNITSLSVVTENNTVSGVFPTAISGAFAYDPSAGYVPSSVLGPGKGYWLKFGAADDVMFVGSAIYRDTIGVHAGWNMIGAISWPVPVENISTTPDTIKVSHFFGYERGYHILDTLLPTKGYWVKSNSDGAIILSTMPLREGSKNIRIIPTGDLPPPPPSIEENPLTNIPTEFRLEQNVPNPFNPTTTIRYSLPVSANVQLTIYDMLGRIVSTLVSSTQSAGNKSVEWNSSGAASGIYLYRLDAASVADPLNRFSQTCKMILLK